MESGGKKKDFVYRCRIRKDRCIIVIYTDADSCPVKEDIDNLAKSYQAESFFVFTNAHVMHTSYYSHSIMLDRGPEAADLYILNHVEASDLVITQDNGLAALVLQKGAQVLSPRGKCYKQHDIDMLLIGRFEGVQAKRGKTKHKGPKSYQREDRLQFAHTLENILKGNDC